MNELELIQEYEKERMKNIPESERQVYHLTPAVGWLNDPNGFCFYNGRYHLYYQYNPFGTNWDVHMRWGAWSSEDLVHWQYEKAAFVPDQSYETGVYSGSAITGKDGKMLVMYTAHYDEKVPADESTPLGKLASPGSVRDEYETQCIASGDGYTFEKSEHNPVIGLDQLPEGSFAGDFRDPKIWLSEDGLYYVIVANRRADNGFGRLLLYRSEDAVTWEFVTTLIENDGSLGRMWECPDMYQLDGKTVIVSSIMALSTCDPHLRNGYTPLAFVGDYDKDTHRFIQKDAERPSPQPVDLGFDFYAPQSMLAPDGRRIMVGWMQAPEAGGNAPERQKWYGMMSVPRELSVKEGHLYQTPVREIRNLYTDSVSEEAHIRGEDVIIAGICGRAADVTVSAEHLERKFEMKFASDGEHYVSLSYCPDCGTLTLDRTRQNRSSSICEIRKVQIGKNDHIRLRVLIDRYSFEIYVNDGAQVLSGTIYELPQEAEGISFSCVSADVKVEKHGMGTIWSAGTNIV